MNQQLGLLGGGLLAAILCLWGNLRELRRRRLLADTPTSKALGVFVGLAEPMRPEPLLQAEDFERAFVKVNLA
jgi:hypothetical protein